MTVIVSIRVMLFGNPACKQPRSSPHCQLMSKFSLPFPITTLLFNLSLLGKRRDVAQPGSALAWGARGRWFKSSRPDHFFSSADRAISGWAGYHSSQITRNHHRESDSNAKHGDHRQCNDRRGRNQPTTRSPVDRKPNRPGGRAIRITTQATDPDAGPEALQYSAEAF